MISENKIMQSILNHQNVVDILLKYKDNSGICRVSQKEIATKLKKSQGFISRILRRLQKVDNCIEILAPGQYIVHNSNLLKNGPLSKVLKLMVSLHNNPRLIKLPYKKQAESLGITVHELEIAYGFIYGAFSSLKNLAL